MHVAKGYIVVANFDNVALVSLTHNKRRRVSGIAVLNIGRHTHDLAGPALELRRSPFQCLAQSQIANRRLTAGVDDCLGADAAHRGIDSQQVASYQLKRNRTKANRSARVMRKHDGNQVVTKVDQYASARHSVGAQNAVGASERIGHDRELGSAECEVADGKALDTHRWHCDRTRHTPKHYLPRLIQGQAQCFGDMRVNSRMVGARIEHQTEWPFVVDVHRRPDTPNTISPGWRNESWLRCLHDDFRQLL